MNKPTTGVVVGRFQVPDLHEGHLELFRAVKSRHERVVVFIGLSPSRNATKRHPLDFETRRRMIQANFPGFAVLPLPDKRTDEEWSKCLDYEINKIRDFGDIELYGSRDSFIPHYKGVFKPTELSLFCKCNGTEIRDSLTNTVKETYDFRAGVIYANQNRRPMSYTAVDIAIFHLGVKPGEWSRDTGFKKYILLAQKPGFDLWRFPGGYSEPNCHSFEDEAKREAYEETGLCIDDLKYVCSAYIKDWRYEKEDDNVKSILFRGDSMTMGGSADDDISSIRWFDFSYALRDVIVPEHKDFLNKLLEKEYE